MQKLPKYVLAIIFLLICGLLFSVICLIRTLLGAEIKLNELQYYVIFGVTSFISFLAGMAFIYPQKAFTIENFVLRMNNVRMINSTIINLQQKKIELIIRDPVLSKIPDTVEVVITKHKIEKEK